MAQEQIQLEFTNELMQAQQIQQILQTNPQNPQLIAQAQALTMKINARKAQLIAEMTKDYMEEEQKIMGEFSGDPLIKLKAREVDLRAKENERKAKDDQERIDLDTAKALMNQENQEDKLVQNEKLAKLRASVSLAKQGMADKSKIHDFGRNFGKK
jgi:N-methylhydantoinase A/oxoprolinase/acetone carboxylase beta subunit